MHHNHSTDNNNFLLGKQKEEERVEKIVFIYFGHFSKLPAKNFPYYSVLLHACTVIFFECFIKIH